MYSIPIEKIKIAVISSSILFIGIIIGVIITLNFANKPKIFNKPEIFAKGKTSLTNPLLWCDQPEGSLQTLLTPFESDVRISINKLESTPAIDKISYYFRELKTGYWIAIKEDTKFMPASLLKLPLAITLYKQAEENPAILEEKLLYSSTQETLPQNYTSHSAKLISGEYYPVKNLIESMIIDSDNQALNALGNISDQQLFEELIALTGTQIGDSPDKDFITVRQYSTFLRLLYNASYISEDNSANLLKILTQTQFKNGLVAGVPEKTTIAHKFGERFLEETGQKQLHDCGIVYYPNNPYILCIMTRGNDFKEQENAIKSLSALTWNKINASMEKNQN